MPDRFRVLLVGLAFGTSLLSSLAATTRPQALFDEVFAAFPEQARRPYSDGFQPAGPPTNVTLKDHSGAWRVDYVDITWEPKSVSQRVRPGDFIDPLSLDETERTARFTRIENHVVLWLVAPPLLGNFLGKRQPAIPLADSPASAPRELAHLGSRANYDWYMEAPIGLWVNVQKKLSLTGDDGIAAAIRDSGTYDNPALFPQAEPFQRLSGSYLSEAGATAVPAMKNEIEQKGESLDPNARGLFFTLIGTINDPQITSWLLEKTKSPSPFIARDALNGLRYSPRPEAEALYVKAALESPDALVFLEALRDISSSHLKEVCSEIRSRPMVWKDSMPWNVYSAIRVPKEATGWTMPKELTDAEQTVRQGTLNQDTAQIEQGKIAILAWPDTDAAQLVALSLALHINKGARNHSANDIGQSLFTALQERAAH